MEQLTIMLQTGGLGGQSSDVWQFWTGVIVLTTLILGLLASLVKHFLAELHSTKLAIDAERTERQRRDDAVYLRLERCQQNEHELNEEFRRMQSTVLTANTMQIERITDTLVAVQKSVELSAARAHDDSQATREVLSKLDDHIQDIRVRRA